MHIYQRNYGAVTVGGIACDVNELLRPMSETEDDMPLNQDDANLVAHTIANRGCGGDSEPVNQRPPAWVLWRQARDGINVTNRQVPSTVPDSTYTADGMQYAANADGYGYDTQQRLNSVESQLAAVLTAVKAVSDGDPVQTDTDAIVKGVLAGLDPTKLADAIASSLGDTEAKKVVEVLGQRLQTAK